jgi:hypothetical protein
LVIVGNNGIQSLWTPYCNCFLNLLYSYGHSKVDRAALTIPMNIICILFCTISGYSCSYHLVCSSPGNTRYARSRDTIRMLCPHVANRNRRIQNIVSCLTRINSRNMSWKLDEKCPRGAKKCTSSQVSCRSCCWTEASIESENRRGKWTQFHCTKIPVLSHGR